METTDDLLRDPNKIKWIYARSKQSGNIVALERKEDFNPVIHEKINITKEETTVAPETTDEARFLELKEIGWVNLNKEQKVEYKALKDKLL